jgi:hypothetical protein
VVVDVGDWVGAIVIGHAFHTTVRGRLDPMRNEVHPGSPHGHPFMVADDVPICEIVNATTFPFMYTLLGICDAAALKTYGSDW